MQVSELVKGIEKVNAGKAETAYCKQCNDTGMVLVTCYQTGDISHAERCLCQVERELNFMNMHAIVYENSMNGRITVWSEEE